ncbi:MAG: hypothetical protein AB7E55_36705 [Pigmentiphaga sp.]
MENQRKGLVIGCDAEMRIGRAVNSVVEEYIDSVLPRMPVSVRPFVREVLALTVMARLGVVSNDGVALQLGLDWAAKPENQDLVSRLERRARDLLAANREKMN